MIIEIEEKDISNVIPLYNPDLPIEDYSTKDKSDGKQGYGLTMKFDMDVILRLLKSVDAKNIFEFGTWLGRTARILAMNIDHVYTIDIPQEEAIEAGYARHQQFGEIPLRDWIGFASKHLPNVTQYYGDAAVLKVITSIKNGLPKKLDSCFIDYDHSFLYTLGATVHAMDIVRSGGLVIWHDVKRDGIVEVAEALDLMPMSVYHVKNTWVGFGFNDWV